MLIRAGRQYRSRRGERVLVTEVESAGFWPVHFIVMDGRYKGVGARDGSRLTRDGHATEPVDGMYKDHLNDLVANWSDDSDVAPAISNQSHPAGSGHNTAPRHQNCGVNDDRTSRRC